MMRVCHLNTCPVGVATQNPELRKKFTGTPDHAVNFMRFVAQEARELMAELGFRTVNEMIGHTECIEMKPAVDHYKAQGLDFSKILYQPDVGPNVGRYQTEAQDHGLEASLDMTAILPAVQAGHRARREGRGEAADPQRQPRGRHDHGQRGDAQVRPDGLPDDTIKLHFTGSAGQSFGAFVPRGMTLTLEGDANDYLGKGLSGGKLIVFPPQRRRSSPRRTSSSATSRCTARPPARRSCAASRASASACATAAPARSSRAWATTAAST
jgi:glutamate synthase (ferredoxin)